MQEGLTRNIGHFSRFLEAASLSQGQTVNISGVAREAQVARPVAENYFSILEDLLIAVRLPVFSRKDKTQTHRATEILLLRCRRVSGHPADGTPGLRSGTGRPGARNPGAPGIAGGQRLPANTTTGSTFGVPGANWKSTSFCTGRSGLLAIEIKRSTQIQAQGHQGAQGIQEGLSTSEMLRLLRRSQYAVISGRYHRPAGRTGTEGTRRDTEQRRSVPLTGCRLAIDRYHSPPCNAPKGRETGDPAAFEGERGIRSPRGGILSLVRSDSIRGRWSVNSARERDS